MIDREYLQSLRELHQECRVAEIPESVFDELCRVYLAWLDAPEGAANLQYSGALGNVKGISVRVEGHEHMIRSKVRLVEVK